MVIKENEKAPDFKLQNTDGKVISLKDLLEKGQVVLLFFPLAFTGTCTEELCRVRDDMKLYDSLNAQIAAISVDSFFTLKKFKNTHNLNFVLLSDFNKKVSEKYGVLYEDFYGMKGVSKRSTFVIDNDGSVKYSQILEDAGKLPDFSAIEEALGN